MLDFDEYQWTISRAASTVDVVYGLSRNGNAGRFDLWSFGLEVFNLSALCFWYFGLCVFEL